MNIYIYIHLHKPRTWLKHSKKSPSTVQSVVKSLEVGKKFHPFPMVVQTQLPNLPKDPCNFAICHVPKPTDATCEFTIQGSAIDLSPKSSAYAAHLSSL